MAKRLTAASGSAKIALMPSLDAVDIVVKDVEASARFYRLLGLDFPEGGGEHIEAKTPGGLRVMLDDKDMIKGYDPSWTEPTGNRMGLAFLCDSPTTERCAPTSG